MVLVAHRGLLLQRGVHFTLADADAALREALAQALHSDFIAHRSTEIVEIDAVVGQALAQCIRSEPFCWAMAFIARFSSRSLTRMPLPWARATCSLSSTSRSSTGG